MTAEPSFPAPCQPTSLGRVAIEYGVYVLTGTVTEIHGGEWVMVLVDPVCSSREGTPITGNPYPVPSVCGRYVPFGMSDVTPLLGVKLSKKVTVSDWSQYTETQAQDMVSSGQVAAHAVDWDAVQGW